MKRLSAINRFHVFKVLVLFIVCIKYVCTTDSAESCHYTCYSCVDSTYTSCTQCLEGQLLVLKDPQAIRQQYQTSHYIEGVCIDISAQYSQFNALGFILLLAAIILIPLVNNSKMFYLISTLQTIGLIGFIEVYWGQTLAYQFNALHYYMPFNLINRILKTQTLQFKQRYFFNLSRYFVTPFVWSSINIIGIFIIIIFVMMVMIPIIQILKRRNCADSCRIVICAQWFFQKIMKILTTAYYFLIQQIMLCLLVSLQFEQSSSSAAIAILVIYLISLIIFCVIVYKIKIPYFNSKIMQYQSIAKKIIYPIFIIIQPSEQYVFLIMMLINFTVEIVFDRLNKQYKLKSVNTLYKFNQFLILLFFLIYYFVQINSDQKYISEVFGGFCLAWLNIFILMIVLQAFLGIKKRFFDKKSKQVNNASELKGQNRQNTIQELQQIQAVNAPTTQQILYNFTTSSSRKPKRQQMQIIYEEAQKPVKPETDNEKSLKQTITDKQQSQSQQSQQKKQMIRKRKRKQDKSKYKDLQKVYGAK